MNPDCGKSQQRRVFISILALSSLLAVLAVVAGELVIGLGLFFLTHMAWLYAQLNPTVQWLGPVVTGFRTDEKEIWLTIDDGPDPQETERVLELLDRYQARATFFVIAKKASENPALIEQIIQKGHQVANHTVSHPESRFWCLSKRRLEAEINDASAIIAGITGQRPLLFRAPVGHKPRALHAVLAEAELPLIAWTARGFDGVLTDSGGIVERIRKNIKPGAIVLLHEGRATLPDTLVDLLQGFSSQGYRCVLPAADSFVCGRR